MHTKALAAGLVMLSSASLRVGAAPLPPGLGFQQHIQLVGQAPGASFVSAVGDARYDPDVVNSAHIGVPTTGLSATASVSAGAARFELTGGYAPCPIGSGGTGVCPFSTAYKSDATIILSDMLMLQGNSTGQTFFTVHFSGSIKGYPFAGDPFNSAYGQAGARLTFTLQNRSNGGGFGDVLQFHSADLPSLGSVCIPNRLNLSCSASIDVDKSYALNWRGDYSQWILQVAIVGYAAGTWEADFGSTAAFGVLTTPDVTASSVSGTFPVAVVPEPATALLFTPGFLLLVGIARRTGDARKCLPAIATLSHA